MPFSMLKGISKRQKFLISILILSLGLLAIQVANISWRYSAIFGLATLTYLLSAWSLKEGLAGIEWLTVLILPTLFTSSVGLFYFIVPGVWWARLPIVLLYSLGLYALLLTENIFSVAAIRTIQLLRSAQAVGFLLTLVTAFFLFDTVFSYRLPFYFNFLLVFAISLPLFLQGFWYINLGEKITSGLLLASLACSLILGEAALSFSFWPVTVSVGSLGLTTAFYILLGLVQHQLSERLFPKTIKEYLEIGLIVFLVIFFTTHWGS